jgi:uncharacterized membrane protein YedE/YeeE
MSAAASSWSVSVLVSVLGGLFIGGAALGFLRATGRIAGMSGLSADLIDFRPGVKRGDALAFLAGLVIVGALLAKIWPSRFGAPPLVAQIAGVRGWLLLAVAGFLVGFGARLAGGCTSGHGVCGVGRLSPRSVVATALFMLAGAATVFVVRHGGGL